MQQAFPKAIPDLVYSAIQLLVKRLIEPTQAPNFRLVTTHPTGCYHAHNGNNPRFQKKGEMNITIYITDRDLPGVTLEQLVAAQKAAIEMSQRFTAKGKPVRDVRTAWVSSESHVMCMFEANDAQAVHDVNEAAGIPFTRILEAMDLTPSS